MAAKQRARTTSPNRPPPRRTGSRPDSSPTSSGCSTEARVEGAFVISLQLFRSLTGWGAAADIPRLLLADARDSLRLDGPGLLPSHDWRRDDASLTKEPPRRTGAHFAEVAGIAAAGLTGLLFVAVSIRIDPIARSRELRNRAAQTLALFFTVLSIAILLSIPGQSFRVLGVELVALAAISGGAMLVLDRRANVDPSSHDATAHAVALILDAVAPNAITSVLLLIAGLLLVFGLHAAGLDVLVLPVLVALAGGVISARLLPDEDRRVVRRHSSRRSEIPRLGRTSDATYRGQTITG